MTDDEQYLRRAIRLAMNGRGKVEPNPMVGCVLMKAGRVIGEGYHTHFGGPHAEPTALASCTESPEGATAYVTLEPCCHTNKKTPPCAPRLIKEKIARVVIGCLDPNPEVNGNGVRMLRDAGIQVDGPLIEAECKQLIAPFLVRTDHNRPYVTLKWAESADRRVAGAGGRRVQISNDTSWATVQNLRANCAAIAVGINTVINDDPQLLPRFVSTPLNYRRMVLDTHLRISTDSQLVRTAHRSPVVIYTSGNAAKRRKTLEAHPGVSVVDGVAVDAGGQILIPDWLTGFGSDVPAHLLVEPGPTLARAMLPHADRLWIFKSPVEIGHPTAPTAATVPDHYVTTGALDRAGDVLTEYLNTRSPAYFAPVSSADLLLSA